MGAAKFPEEIVERFVECDPVSLSESVARHQQPSRPRPKLKYCPLCFEGYLEEVALDAHVATSHGKQHIYLKVNGRIVRDVCWINGPLEECVLVLLGVPSLDVVVEADGEESRRTIQRTASLMGAIHAGRREGTIRIRTDGGPFSRSFTIYADRQPRFQTRRLDEALGHMMGRIKQRQPENLVAFRDKWRREGLNDLETRYLDGVIEYCHGWQLEADGQSALSRNRLEAAMDLVMPFKTELAEDLRCALAIRMNCFGGQWGCDDDSPFRPAESFFCMEQLAKDGPDRRMRETIIPIDSFSELVLEALMDYYADEDRRVFEILNRLRSGSRVRDRNDEDKLNLIEARTKARMGDRLGAAAVYELFLGHPRFGREAESQLHVLA